MKCQFKIYTKDIDGTHLIAEGDYRTVELFREACQNIHVEEVETPDADVLRGQIEALKLKASLDYTRALADYHGAF